MQNEFLRSGLSEFHRFSNGRKLNPYPVKGLSQPDIL